MEWYGQGIDLIADLSIEDMMATAYSFQDYTV